MDKAIHIALLEDDIPQAEMVSNWLQIESYEVSHFATAIELLDALRSDCFDLMIFDWELPDKDGVEVLRHVRKELSLKTPIIFATQRDSEENIIKALTEGADDYLVKPLRQGELMARIKSLSRRAGLEQSSDLIEVGPIKIDKKTESVTVSDDTIKLTDKEFQVACFLLQNEGKLFSRDYLLKTLWGVSAAIHTRTVDSHVSKVRRLLKIGPEMGYRIKTIYQHGYRFEKTH
ncbi:response regulator transcription factor [Aurantivibrio infirmus]